MRIIDGSNPLEVLDLPEFLLPIPRSSGMVPRSAHSWVYLPLLSSLRSCDYVGGYAL